MTRPAAALSLALALTLAPAFALPAQEEEKAQPEKPAPALAHIKLAGDLGDRRTPELPFGRPPLTYRAFLQVLEKAQADPAVRGILLELDEPMIGPAKARGIAEALARLKKSGKKVYLHAEMLMPVGAILGSQADRLSLPESGSIILPGVGAQVLYLKGLFDLLGIDWLVIQEKEYKTAFESFSRDRMSPQQREVLESILDQAEKFLLETISGGRRIPQERVREAIDEAILSARRARELGLIDAVEYRDQFEAAIREELGQDLKVVKNYGRGAAELDLNNPFTLFAQLMKLFSPPSRGRGDPSPKLAVIYAEGIITGGKSQTSPFGGPGTVGSETLVKAIDEAAGDDSVKAILLRVDSPGGSGAASDAIWRALWRAREKKPVVASMSDIAGSGGYYIAMAAHVIVAQPETITGSIGVIAARPNLEKLLGFWGVRSERILRGKNAGVFDIFSPPDDAERRALEAYVAGFYRDFVAKVAMSRGLPVEQVEEVARGRVWTGAQAREKKLVDELGGLERAMEIAIERAGLPRDAAPRVVEYPEAPSFFESLSEAFEVRGSLGLLAALAARNGAAEPGSPAFGAPGAPVAALFPAIAGSSPIARRLWQLLWLKDDVALAIQPFDLRIR